MNNLIRYKGQLYRRIDSANQEFVKYLELNKNAKESVLKFAKDDKSGKEYVKALDEAIRHLKNDKVSDAKRALETAIKHSTNPHDTNALKSVVQKLK